MKSFMVAGTNSSCGKSFVTTALIRYFRGLGWRVAPFKALNISAKPYMLDDKRAMGFSTFIHARAAEIQPDALMNPVYIKPEANSTKIYVWGELVCEGAYTKFYDMLSELKEKIREAYEIMKERYDVIVIEGSGSAAEINCRNEDLANGYMAELASPEVILVGDIHLGGVFASIHGTIDFMSPPLQKQTKAFVINRYSGEKEKLKSGIDMLEACHGVKCLGVIPYMADMGVLNQKLLDNCGKQGIDEGNLSLITKQIFQNEERVFQFCDFTKLM